MIGPMRVRACALLALTALAGCAHAPTWMVQRDVTVEDVARVLDEPSATERPLTPSDIPAIPVRVGLRPCCAFGVKLGASIGPIPVPFFSLSNIIGLDQVGPHTYDAEPFSTSGSSKKDAFMEREQRAPLHLPRRLHRHRARARQRRLRRCSWSATIARASLTGATIELPSEGGARRLHLRPLPPDLVERYGLRRVAISVGAVAGLRAVGLARDRDHLRVVGDRSLSGVSLRVLAGGPLLEPARASRSPAGFS